MKNRIEIQEALFIKEKAVKGQLEKSLDKLTKECEHDLNVQIDMLKWILK